MAKFPFDMVTDSTVKLKNTPIELHWNLREGFSPVRSPKQGAKSAPTKQRIDGGRGALPVGSDC